MSKVIRFTQKNSNSGTTLFAGDKSITKRQISSYFRLGIRNKEQKRVYDELIPSFLVREPTKTRISLVN
jgi:hypothetical protein